MDEDFVSILMLTHNAPDHVRISIESVRAHTRGVAFELVVLDNASGPETVALLQELRDAGLIDRLVLSPVNTLFAAGNNIAARHADPRATHYLLLNSDIEVQHPDWLAHLLDTHRRPGISAYGVVAHPPLRVDGYCLLIEAALYARYGGLDEEHQWWWAVTRLQAQLLRDGLPVQGYWEHEGWLHHYGGRSGDGFRGARGMDVCRAEAVAWFDGHAPDVIDLWKMRLGKARTAINRRLRLAG